MSLTAKRGIIVQIEVWDLHDNFASRWASNPWNPANNAGYPGGPTRLATAYPQLRYRGDESDTPPHDFLLSVPELNNDRPLLAAQERYVDELLSHTLPCPHVLYCVTNEIHPQYPPEWGWHWARHIRKRSLEAGRDAYVTEMYWQPNLADEQHRASLDRPGVFDFFEASQNSATRDPETAWRLLMFARNRLAERPRPVNHTKIYGADTSPWPLKERDAVGHFWRNLFAGSASSRFHRPPMGMGLNPSARTHIRSARMLAMAFDFFRAEPDGEHRFLIGRTADGAYLCRVPGRQYAVSLPNGKGVGLDLSEADGRFSLRWLDVAASEWREGGAAEGGGTLALQAPGPGRWVALLTAEG